MLNIHINKKLKKKELQHLVGTLSDAKHFLRFNFFFFKKSNTIHGISVIFWNFFFSNLFGTFIANLIQLL